MKAAQFRQDKDRVRLAQKILHDPTMIEMLEVLVEEHPLRYGMVGGIHPTTADDRSHRLGRIEGAEYILMTLKSLGTLQKPNQEASQSYGTE